MNFSPANPGHLSWHNLSIVYANRSVLGLLREGETGKENETKGMIGTQAPVFSAILSAKEAVLVLYFWRCWAQSNNSVCSQPNVEGHWLWTFLEDKAKIGSVLMILCHMN